MLLSRADANAGHFLMPLDAYGALHTCLTIKIVLFAIEVYFIEE